MTACLSMSFLKHVFVGRVSLTQTWVDSFSRPHVCTKLFVRRLGANKIACTSNVDNGTISTTPQMASHCIFRQLFEFKSYTCTYIIGDADTKEGIIIDPVIETVDRDLKIIYELGIKLVYAVNTHVHADHVTGSGEIKKRIPSCRSVISAQSGAISDVKVTEGDVIQFGSSQIKCRSTPGHTNGCMTYVWHEKNMAFTGDVILVRGCGRTDFQEGNSEALYKSVHEKIFSLPDHYFLYPAHDYTGHTVTTVREEKLYNPRLNKPMREFIRIMKDLNLPYPSQIDKSLPANMVCGVYDVKAPGSR